MCYEVHHIATFLSDIINEDMKENEVGKACKKVMVKQSHYRHEVPKGFWKLRLPHFVTTAQDGGRLSTLRTGQLYPQEMLLVVRSEGFYVNEKSNDTSWD